MTRVNGPLSRTELDAARLELACYDYPGRYSLPAGSTTIATMREMGMGWVSGVVTQCSGTRLTISDGHNSVEVTLHPWVKRAHAGDLVTIKAAIGSGSTPAVSIKLRHNEYCSSTTVWYCGTVPEAQRCVIMLLSRRLKLYAGE